MYQYVDKLCNVSS